MRPAVGRRAGSGDVGRPAPNDGRAQGGVGKPAPNHRPSQASPAWPAAPRGANRRAGKKSTESNDGPRHRHVCVSAPKCTLAARANPITRENCAGSTSTRRTGEHPRHVRYERLTDDLTLFLNVCIVEILLEVTISRIKHGLLSMLFVSSVVRISRRYPVRGSNIGGEPPPVPRRSCEAA
jgi:hypothetical protein